MQCMSQRSPKLITVPDRSTGLNLGHRAVPTKILAGAHGLPGHSAEYPNQGGAMPSRLHQQAQIIGWDTTWLHVCFDHDRALVVLRAHLVRVLDSSRRSG
jgi:hypothetical protein